MKGGGVNHRTSATEIRGSCDYNPIVYYFITRMYLAFPSSGLALMPGTGSCISRCVSFRILRGKTDMVVERFHRRADNGTEPTPKPNLLGTTHGHGGGVGAVRCSLCSTVANTNDILSVSVSSPPVSAVGIALRARVCV